MEIVSIDQPLRHYDVIYVSPHLDDAAFSCSSHIRQQLLEGKAVLVVSVFTKSPPASTENLKGSLKPLLDLDARRAEDECAMKDLGVDFHYLDQPEVLIRHGGSHHLPDALRLIRAFLVGVVSKELDLELELGRQLEKLISKTACEWIISPAGIGFHPDHLVTHRTCSRVAHKLRLWHYYDFPYCTYPSLVRLRRWGLDLKYSLTDFCIELSANQIADRRRILAMYDSQTNICFGCAEKRDLAINMCPTERFVEVTRAIDEEADGAANELKASRDQLSAPWILSLMLFLDLAVSFIAFNFVHRNFDWDNASPRAMKSVDTVIFLSAARVACFFWQVLSLKAARWLCVSSVCSAAVACSYMAGEKSIFLFVYFALQFAFGYAESKFASVLQAESKFVSALQWGKASEPRSEKMNILVVSDYMPPQTHGISTHTHGLVCALRAAGCKVHVYTTTIAEGEPTDATFTTWSLPNPFNPDVKVAILPSLKLLRAVVFGDWDVVHIVFPSLIPWPVVVGAWLSGKPIYASQHCSENLGAVYVNCFFYHCILSLYLLWSGLPLYLFATINAGPTYGFLKNNLFLKRYSSERVAVVPSSVDSAVFNCDHVAKDRASLRKRLCINDERPLWLLVSRLAPEKDVWELLRGLKHHIDNCKKGTSTDLAPLLVIAGDGPERAGLEEFVQKEMLPVRFLGFVRGKTEVASLYRACDVCATNSIHETFGLTVLESLACGCPMVMPHCDVFDELYGDVLSEWMYRKGDVVSLTEALCRGARRESRDYVAALRREKGFNPNLFWSWTAAAVEQIAQYRRCYNQLHTKRRCMSVMMRNVLVSLSLLTMCFFALIDGL